MKSTVSLGIEGEATLKKAIMIYEVGGGQAVATIHDIVDRTSFAPELGPGRPAGKSFIRELAGSLSIKIAPELLPANVLARTSDVIVWWTEPKRRRMFFGGQLREQGMRSAVFPHPALLWVVKDGSLDVFALISDARPTESTGVFVAPYWNTSQAGDVCQGTMASPKDGAVASIEAWERAYFASEFTHSNGDRLCSYPGGLNGMWMLALKAGQFPIGCLVKTKTTVGKIIGSL